MALRMLFVGGLYLGCGNIPQLLRDLAVERAGQACMTYDQKLHECHYSDSSGVITCSPLSEHIDDVIATMASKRYDVLVVQPCPHDDHNGLPDLAQICQQHDCELLLFCPWPPDGSIQGLNSLHDHIQTIARRTRACIAPIAKAWLAAQSLLPDKQLIGNSRDGTPAPAGIYLNACVLYAVCTGTSPEGLTKRHIASNWQRDDLTARHAHINDDLACALQAIAWKTVSSEHTKGSSCMLNNRIKLI